MNARTRMLPIRLDEAQWRALEDLADADDSEIGDFISDGLLDQIGQLAAVYAAEPVPSASDLVDPRERLRARYRPDDIQLLFVGESAPAGGSFFYQADSNLFSAIREACGHAYGSVPEGEAFLAWFRDQGWWLWDLSQRPVDRQRGRPRNDAVEAGTLRLARLIRETGPNHVVAVLRSIEPSVRKAADLARYRDADIRVLPFPTYQWRGRFIEELARFLGPGWQDMVETFGTETAHSIVFEQPIEPVTVRTLPEAITRVLEDSGNGRLSSRRIANEIADRDLYRRDDGRYPSARHVRAGVARHPLLFESTRAGIRLRGLDG